MHTNLFDSHYHAHWKFLEDCPDLSEDRPDTFYVRASKFKTNEQHRTEET